MSTKQYELKPKVTAGHKLGTPITLVTAVQVSRNVGRHLMTAFKIKLPRHSWI